MSTSIRLAAMGVNNAIPDLTNELCEDIAPALVSVWKRAQSQRCLCCTRKHIVEELRSQEKVRHKHPYMAAQFESTVAQLLYRLESLGYLKRVMAKYYMPGEKWGQ